MALTDTEDFFRLSVIAMSKRRSIFDFREQRARAAMLAWIFLGRLPRGI